MSPRLLLRTKVYDNTVRNRGVAVAWNYGALRMREEDADWLVVISAAMRFGAPGGDDFLDHVDRSDPDAWAVEAGECPRQPGHGFGWHLIAFPRRTFDRVGDFDENFFAYYEDNDFGHRVRCAADWTPGVDPVWPKVDVDADLAGYAHGIRLGGVISDPNKAVAYYRSKWGGPPSCEEWTTPFGEDRPLSFWRPPNRQPAR